MGTTSQLQRITVKLANGDILEGRTADFNPTSPSFHLEHEGGLVTRIEMARVQFIHFGGDPGGLRDPRRWSTPTASADRIIVTFSDGDAITIYGTVMRSGPRGSLIAPAGAENDSERIFLPPSALAKVQVDPAAGVSEPEAIAASAPAPPQPSDARSPNLAGVGRALSVEDRKRIANQRLGEVLLAAGLITSAQLTAALEDQQRDRSRKLGDILVDHKAVSPDALSYALALQFGLPYVSLDDIPIDATVVKYLPEGLARKYTFFPLKVENRVLTLATADPVDVRALDSVRNATGMVMREVIAPADAIRRAIATYYGGRHALREIAGRLTIERGEVARPEDLLDLEQLGSETAMVTFVSRIIREAVTWGASDIHILPQHDGARVLYRMDGVLQEQVNMEKEQLAAVVSRIKILGEMDITEHRLPQDGRARLRLDDRTVDLRISIIPTVVGESVVIRVLDKGVALRNLDGLGFDPHDLAEYRRLIRRPQGMVLVTGPTGSGKTTTLYATLQEVRAEVPRPHIVTVEDPVEYEIPDVNQIQVKPKIGFNFAAALRNIVRHDPDVILVGEIRDVETAALAVQAALTGHRVLSTFHTNDAASALTRLIDMEVEPFLIVSCVLGVLGQRLVRVICADCKQPYAPDDLECRRLGIEPTPELRLYRGVGCKKCGKTGYRGRAAVYEFLRMDETVRRLVIERESSTTINTTAVKAGMRTMPDNLVAKVREGITTAEEALRLGLIDIGNGY